MSWHFRWPRISLFCILWCLAHSLLSQQASLLGERDLPHLSDNGLLALVKEAPDPSQKLDPNNPSSHLSKILIPRPPDTENNTMVRNYIVTTLKNLHWHIKEDAFTGQTPVGKKHFTNIIATKNPAASRRVVLAAHFDSKYFSNYPQNQFVGATDSAAPCAMMLDIAETLNNLLEERKKLYDAGLVDDGDDDDIADMTLQLVFFDGEEAFHDWTDTDSIYGARHLAEKWSKTYAQSHEKRRLLGLPETEISTIEHLILLDLLGAPQPLIKSYFPDTAWLFDALIRVEKRLGDSGAFTFQDDKTMAPGSWHSYFLPRSQNKYAWGHIGDDHVPFLKKGVSVLHLIADPFPRVWHTLKDDATALDIPTMRRWSLILRVFLAEYLHLQPEPLKARTESRNSSPEAKDSRFQKNTSEL